LTDRWHGDNGGFVLADAAFLDPIAVSTISQQRHPAAEMLKFGLYFVATMRQDAAMRIRCSVLLPLTVVGLFANCGDNMASIEPDAAGVDGGFVPAAHGAVPQLISLGGPVLVAPKVQAIFFAGDTAMKARIEEFLALLPSSNYWPATTSEYGVGSLTVLPTIVTGDPPPTTEANLDTFLSAHLDGTHTGFPTADSSTIYSLFLPAGAVLTSSDGSKSCEAYAAFHSEVTGVHGESIVYAFMPRCGAQGSQLDELTTSFSHELVEAATDPRVVTAPAFGDVDSDHAVWGYTPGAENGDFCEYDDQANQRLVGSFAVQRSWSNAAAVAGHDPCVPAPATPYMAAAPLLNETLKVTEQSGSFMTKGVKIPKGTSKTIEVALFSDAPTVNDFTVKAFDGAGFSGGQPELTFAWDRTTGHNGDKLHLTITRVSDGQDIGTGANAGSEFAIDVHPTKDTAVSLWWGYAGN
jgi:hypothetical protein